MIYDIENMRIVKEHNLRVGNLSYELAKLLYISEEECKNIKIAGQYHDIGKKLIPRDILLKPSALNEKELKVMQQHAILSYQILKNRGFNEKVCNMVKHHHENFNGTGYPDKLKGFQIPIGSVVIKICDVFDALTNDRVYRKRMTYTEAIKVMEEESNHFEPEAFKIFKNELICDVLNFSTKEEYV